MTDTKGLAVQAIALKVLGDKVTERAVVVRAELASALDVGDRKTAALADGTKVGSITYANGRVTPRVVDERAFTAWVSENYPDEIVPLVRSSFRDAILAQAKANDAPVTANGELVPGIELRPGNPYLTAKPEPGVASVLLDAMRASALLAIEAGPGDPPEFDPLEGE